jgi:hypothetical protein
MYVFLFGFANVEYEKFFFYFFFDLTIAWIFSLGFQGQESSTAAREKG